jgi:hypothetical protein
VLILQTEMDAACESPGRSVCRRYTQSWGGSRLATSRRHQGYLHAMMRQVSKTNEGRGERSGRGLVAVSKVVRMRGWLVRGASP